MVKAKTASNRRSSVHFLPVKKFGQLDTHDDMLARSDARSHAARTAHDRARRKTKCSSAEQTFEIYEHPDQPQDHKRHRRSPSPFSYIVHGGLDSFLVLAGTLSPSDSMQLHQCMSSAPLMASADRTDLLKFVSGNAFCPIRDVIVPKLAVTPAMVQCLMLISDLSIEANNQVICLRRVGMLNCLRALAHVDTIFAQESTAITLATAIVAEYRTGNVAAARHHGAALRQWLDLRGGYHMMEKLPVSTQVGLLIVFTYFDLPILQTRSSFSDALQRFEVPRGCRIEWLQKYIYIGSDGPQIALLYVLNFLLADADPFTLSLLEEKVGAAVDLAPGALISLIFEAQANSRAAAKDNSLSAAKTIEFVQMLSFATIRTRTAVVNSLVQTLSGQVSTVVDREVLKDEMCYRWMRTLRAHAAVRNDSAALPSIRCVPSRGSGWILDLTLETDEVMAESAQTRRPKCPMWVRSRPG